MYRENIHEESPSEISWLYCDVQHNCINIKLLRSKQLDYTSVHVLRPVPYGKLTVSTIKPTTSAPRIKLTISTPWIPISLVVVFLVRWWWYITVAAVD
jgi:hypothetical protein